jgi:4-amino-4-deoxy-L-arabinose transferase-like glycosyltransferase
METREVNRHCEPASSGRSNPPNLVTATWRGDCSCLRPRNHSSPSAVSTTADDPHRWRLRAIGLIAAVTAVRLVIIGTTEIADGEAYYYMWSRFPALSYYDHPPLVAWMAWLTTLVSHASPAIRLGPVICAALFGLLVYRLGERLFSPRAGFIALVIVTALPVFILTSFVLNPESPLAPLWMLCLLLVEGMREHDEPWRPILAGAVMGLAFLAKFTAILLVPVVLIYLAASLVSRRWLRRPSLYVGGLLALVFASPVIIWNYQHGWPSLVLHLVERAAPMSLAAVLGNAVHVALGQLPAYHLFLFPVLLAALVVAIRRSGRDDRYRFLALTSWPVLLFLFAIMARVRDSESHWTMVGFMPVAVAAGGWFDEVADRISRAFRWYFRVSVALSAAATVVAFVYAQSPRLLQVVPAWAYDPNSDVLNEMVGWDRVKPAIQEAAAQLGRGTMVASSQYALCAHILKQLDDQPNVYCPTERRTEFDFIGRHNPPPEAPVLYVENDHYSDAPSQRLPDRECQLVRDVTVARGERVVRHYRLYACLPVNRPGFEKLFGRL